MDKLDIAVMRMKEASQMSLQVYQKPLLVTYSGGKDSDTILEIAKIAKIPFEVVHSHTTIDAPETVYHVRRKFHDLELEGIHCEIHWPVYKGKRTSIWKLIVLFHIPPTRFMRYCCSILKETAGDNRFIVTGVRWEESNKRRNRGIYEKFGSSAKNKIVLQNDNDEKRTIFENCYKRSKHVVNPIIDWEDKDVFDFLQSEKIDINPLYCEFSRVGCVGCPLASPKFRKREFHRFPKYKRLYLIAFDKMLREYNEPGKKSKWKSAMDVFNWWMEDKNIEGQIRMEGFEDDDSIL